MSTTTTTTNTVEPTWYVSADHKGFTFEPDQAVGQAVANMLAIEGATFDALVDACRDLATADAASKLSASERATLAASVVAAWPGRPDLVNTMTGATYSKRCKVGRATDDQVIEFLMVCADPTLNKFYEWLPKVASMAKPRTPKASAPAVVDPEPESDDADDAGPVEPYRWDDGHIRNEVAAILRSLTTMGADAVSQRLVAAEMMRQLSPVRSAGQAAA